MRASALVGLAGAGAVEQLALGRGVRAAFRERELRGLPAERAERDRRRRASGRRVAMPMGTTSKRARSMAASTDAAPARETSCSPDRPPNTTPTRSRLSAMLWLYQSPRAGPRSLRAALSPGACASRHCRQARRRSASSFSAPRSVGR